MDDMKREKSKSPQLTDSQSNYKESKSNKGTGVTTQLLQMRSQLGNKGTLQMMSQAPQTSNKSFGSLIQQFEEDGSLQMNKVDQTSLQIANPTKNVLQHGESEGNSSNTFVTQLARADVNYQIGTGGVQNVIGEEVGRGGIGGVSHSEQKVWSVVRDGIIRGLEANTTNADVEFEVDTTICYLCAPWFENTVWVELNNACSKKNSTFTLKVTVGGNTVNVNGSSTIWPPEVADAHTFDRMDDMEKSMLYLNENRDENGRVKGEPQNKYVSSQVERINELVETNQYFGLTLDKIKESFDAGKDDSCKINDGRFEIEDETLAEYLDTITFSNAISEGMIAIPDLDEEEDFSVRIKNWLIEMKSVFKFYFTYKLEEHFDEVQGEFEYGQ